MTFSIVFHPLAAKEIANLDNRVRLLVFKQIKKLALVPGLGKELGNKQGIDLSGYRKLYADNKKIRIVYKIVHAKVLIQVIAVGKGEGMKAYKTLTERKQNEKHV